MRKIITPLALSIGLIFLLAAASPERKFENKNIPFTCSMSASPTQLDFGLRNQPDPYQINVTSNTYWEFYTQSSWLRVNNQTTYIGSNNQAVTITTSGSIPSGTQSGCDNITTGYILLKPFDSSCPDILITVRYHVCPCC